MWLQIHVLRCDEIKGVFHEHMAFAEQIAPSVWLHWHTTSLYSESDIDAANSRNSSKFLYGNSKDSAKLVANRIFSLLLLALT